MYCQKIVSQTGQDQFPHTSKNFLNLAKKNQDSCQVIVNAIHLNT